MYRLDDLKGFAVKILHHWDGCLETSLFTSSVSLRSQFGHNLIFACFSELSQLFDVFACPCIFGCLSFWWTSVNAIPEAIPFNYFRFCKWLENLFRLRTVGDLRRSYVIRFWRCFGGMFQTLFSLHVWINFFVE